MNLHLDASATMCLVNRRGLGKVKPVSVQYLWMQEASKSEKFLTKKGGTHVNPADEGKCVPVRVERMHHGRTYRSNRARRRDHNRWRTIGGGIPHQEDVKKNRDQEADDRRRRRP